MKDWIKLLIAFSVGFFDRKMLLGTLCGNRLIEGDENTNNCSFDDIPQTWKCVDKKKLNDQYNKCELIEKMQHFYKQKPGALLAIFVLN